MHTRTNVHTHTHTRTHTNAHTHTHTHAQTYTHIHTHTHTHTHTRAHTHMHTHTRTHTSVALVRNPALSRHWEGIYVLYTYAARRQTARTIQLMLSNPEVGSENVLLRHMTLCKY